MFLLFLFLLSSAAGAERDAKADAVGRELLAAMGGEANFERARLFQFDFVVVREGKEAARFRHVWDRYTGDYRLMGTNKAGAPYTVYFNANTKEGKAFVNDRPVAGEEGNTLVTTAYGRLVNDTYWLLAPWKIFDPGVTLTYDGEKACPDGGVCDVLRLSFEEGVGLTPKDVYWLWVTRDGRRMIQWQYVLGGAQEEPALALWKDWRSFAGLLLSLEKEVVGRSVVIRFEALSVSAARDDALLVPPSLAPRE